MHGCLPMLEKITVQTLVEQRLHDSVSDVSPGYLVWLHGRGGHIQDAVAGVSDRLLSVLCGVSQSQQEGQ